MQYNAGWGSSNQYYDVKNIIVGTTQQLTWGYEPQEVKRNLFQDISVKSSNNEILSIDSSKYPFTLTGKKAGTVTLTIRDIKTGIEATKEIKVGEVKDICNFEQIFEDYNDGRKKWIMKWHNDTNRQIENVKATVSNKNCVGGGSMYPSRYAYMYTLLPSYTKGTRMMMITFEINGEEYEVRKYHDF